MTLSMKTLVGALCLFASAILITAPASAREGGESPMQFLLKYGDAANGASSDVKAEGASTTKPRAAYAKLIRKVAEKHGVPEKIAMAVVKVESNFNPRARGSAGEIGLMQIKPATARGLGFRGTAKALYDPSTNLEWGMRYLAGAHKLASGDVCGTILRYNAGHYAKRMNPVSRRYCQKVKSILAGI